MEITTSKITSCSGIKFSVKEDGKEVGRAFLYLIYNDLHKEPFGFIEDVFVDENCRGQGIGTDLVKRVLEEAQKQSCYKVICTSRYGKEKVHELYTKLGFKNHGIEFRIDYKK
jgi:GNAT superfamily N-acetyltransferase